MKPILTLLLFLAAFVVPSFAHTVYRPSEAGEFVFACDDVTDRQPTIQANGWLSVTVTTGVKNDLPITALIIRHSTAIEYRVGRVRVIFGSVVHKLEIVQAGRLQIQDNSNDEIVSDQVTHCNVRRVWFVSDNSDLVRNLRAYPTRAAS